MTSHPSHNLERLLAAIESLAWDLRELLGEGAWEEIQDGIQAILSELDGVGPDTRQAEGNEVLQARFNQAEARIQGLLEPFPEAQTLLAERMAAMGNMFSLRNTYESTPPEDWEEDSPQDSPEDGPVLVTRYTDVVCPRRVGIDEPRVSVIVRLTMEANRQSAGLESIAVRPDLPVHVRIEAPQFELLNDQVQRVVILPDRDSAPVVFDLRPRTAGATHISLDFFQGTQPLRTVAVAVEVVGHAVESKTESLPSEPLHMDGAAEAPQMVLHVAWDPVAHQLQMSLIQQGGAWWRTFAPVTLRNDPAQFATELYNRIVEPNPALRHLAYGEARPEISSGEISSAVAERRVRKLGQSLWEQVIPQDFKRLYAEERETWQDRTLLILSDEPYLPWELIWPYDDELGEWEDGQPWCGSFRMCRWLRRDEHGNGNEMAPMWLDLDALAVFVPQGSQLGDLPFARKEEAALVELMARYQVRRSGPDIPTWRNVVDFLEGGDYGWVHFAAHGSFFAEQTDGDASLWLQDDQALSTHDLTGADIRRHFRKRKPAFFFNACEVGRQGYALARISGWANRLVSTGAGMFVGPLWAVRDASASAFAQAFYAALMEGKTVAAAARLARASTMQPNDPTWLAYSIYAHPNARARLPIATSESGDSDISLEA